MRLATTTCTQTLALGLALAACGSKATTSPTPAADDDAALATAPGAECEDAPGWRYERIELPPEFAPSLPKGTEILYFAPGMFDAASPGYFRYVFSLSFDAPLGDADMRTLLYDYYHGLMTAVASGKSIAAKPTVVSRTDEAPGPAQRWRIDTYDAFGDGRALALDVALDVTARCVRAMVAPVAPTGDRDGLRKALACVPCP